jgi:hypothetical protein
MIICTVDDAVFKNSEINIIDYTVILLNQDTFPEHTCTPPCLERVQYACKMAHLWVLGLPACIRHATLAKGRLRDAGLDSLSIFKRA